MNSIYQRLLTKMLTVLVVLAATFSIAQAFDATDYGELNDGVLHVDATVAAEILKANPDVKVLDVRTGLEYGRGHLEDATNVNYYSFSFRKQLEELDKNTTWLVHCRTGVRSGKSLPIMRELGFTSIVHLDGGIVAWTEAGQPTAK